MQPPPPYRNLAIIVFAVGAAVPWQHAHALEYGGVNSNLTYWTKIQVVDFVGGTKRAGWSVDVIERRQSGFDDNNPFRHTLRSSVRPWIFYQITPLARLSLAPVSWHYDEGLRATEDRRDGTPRHELRSTLEFDNSVFFGNIVMLTHRYRAELRYYHPGQDNSELFFRLRYRLRGRVSLNNLNFYDPNCIYMFGYNELHVQYGGGPNLWVNQNRSFLGAGYRFQRYMRVDLGYIAQWSKPRAGDLTLLGHGPMLYFTVDYLSALEPRAWLNQARDTWHRAFGPAED